MHIHAHTHMFTHVHTHTCTHTHAHTTQYENEACLFGSWGKTGLTRPHWSDTRGKIKQPQEAFEPPPPGWNWVGPWFKSPELRCVGSLVSISCFIRSLVAIFSDSLSLSLSLSLSVSPPPSPPSPSPSCISLAYEPDEGLDEWTEDVFESQVRLPLSSWPGEDKSYWSDIVSWYTYGGWWMLRNTLVAVIRVDCHLCKLHSLTHTHHTPKLVHPYAHTHAHTHAHTRTCTCTHTHAHTLMHTHTHT